MAQASTCVSIGVVSFIVQGASQCLATARFGIESDVNAQGVDHREQPVVSFPIHRAMVACRRGIDAENEPSGIDIMIAAELPHDTERWFDHVLLPADQ